MKLILIFPVAFCIATCTVFAGDGIPHIPPSPDAASLGKYGDMPVNLYNGLPDIRIPLYEINIRDVTVPISMRYYASGIRVEEESGWVGLGWSLNAGGIITRTVNGMDDFLHSVNHNYHGYIYSNDSVLDSENYPAIDSYLHDICVRTEDPQPDIFYFNFSGHTGKFFIEKKRNPDDPVTIRLLSPEKMDFSYNEVDGKWTVWTVDGFRYDFSEKEYTENWYGAGSSPAEAVNSIKPPSILIPADQKFISTWLLTRITSPMGQQINFGYKRNNADGNEYAVRSLINISETREQGVGFGRILSEDGCLVGSPYEDYGIIPMKQGYDSPLDLSCVLSKLESYTSNLLNFNNNSVPVFSSDMIREFRAGMRVYFQAYLDRIDFGEGYVDFTTANREDYEELNNDDRFPGKIFSRSQYLKQIRIFNKGNEMIRTIDLSYSYFNDVKNEEPFRYKRLKLNSIAVRGQEDEIPPYRFEYDESVDLPPKDSGSRDHWGYFNNADNNSAGTGGYPSLIPSMDIITWQNRRERFESADREPDEAYTRAGILKKTVYPTGGFVEYIYENHSFNIDQAEGSLPEHSTNISTVNNNQVIDLKYPATMVFDINLKCSTAACYAGGTSSPCAIPDPNEPYFTLSGLQDDHELLRELYADYACISDPGSQWGMDHDITILGNKDNPCGIYRRVLLVLESGRYLIRINPVNDIDVNVAAHFMQPRHVTVNYQNLIVKGGGLRIRKIIIHDGLDEKDNIVREYQYEFPDSEGVLRSAGKLMSFPCYGYGEYFISRDPLSGNFLMIRLRLSSYSNIPLSGSASTCYVGYDSIRENIGTSGTGGYAIYHFINEPDKLSEPYFPFTPSVTYAFKNGLLTKQTDFNKNHFKVREIINEYDAKDLGGIRGIDLLNYQCGSNTIFLGDNYHYVYDLYRLPFEWWYKSESEEKYFDMEDAGNTRYLSRKNYYSYSDYHKQITQTITVNSGGQPLINNYYYPSDVPALAPPQMWDVKNPDYRHLNNLLIRKVTYLKNDLDLIKTSEKINYYKYDNSTGKVLPDHVDESRGNAVPEIKIEFLKYDAAGNLLEFRKYGSPGKPGLNSVLLWGYNYTLPVALIENATYEEVLDAVNKVPATMEMINSSFDPDELNGIFQKIMKSLPASKMSACTYKPLAGVSSITDPNGKTTCFTFDSLQRLLKTTDFEKNILNEYGYGYGDPIIRN